MDLCMNVGGVRNIYVHDALFEDCDRGIRMKSNRGRGGIVENIFVENVTMTGIRRGRWMSSDEISHDYVNTGCSKA